MEEDEEEKSTPEVLKRFINQYKEHIQDTAYYIEHRDWGRKIEKNELSDIISEHKMEWVIIGNIAKRLKDFIKEAEAYLHRDFAINFIILLKDLLDRYIARANKFRKLNKWAEIEDDDEYMTAQLAFQEELLTHINEINKLIGSVNLDKSKEVKKIPIHGDKKVPFLMKDIIEKKFPKQFAE